MMYRRSAVLTASIVVSLASPAAALAQQPGGMKGMPADSATRALMMISHQLVMDHDRITRTVTLLPNGVRTTTESNDPRVAALIKQHVDMTTGRVAKGDDPGMPMESAALHQVFAMSDRIKTTTEKTARGVVVVQTSDDSVAVAALRKHASEVTALVDGGMAAMHAAMMGRGAMPMSMPATDTAFAAMQQRGMKAMGVDQYTSTHHFDALPDGGRIELQRDVDDSAGVAQIRAHLQGIARAFGAGDFSTPAFVHMKDVPGAKVMAAKRDVITYSYRDLPRGGEVKIQSSDSAAVAAIHEFLAFQRMDHRAP